MPKDVDIDLNFGDGADDIETGHIDLEFGEAAGSKPWPDQKFTRDVAQALDTLSRHAHIQVYTDRAKAGDGENATIRKVVDLGIVFPTTMLTGGRREWCAEADEVRAIMRKENPTRSGMTLQDLKTRMTDYPDAVAALDVISQVAEREVEWKNAFRETTTPEASQVMLSRIQGLMNANDCVSVPHSDVSNSPHSQLARIGAVSDKKMSPIPPRRGSGMA